jgi:serine protease Do
MRHAFGFALLVGWVIVQAPVHAQVPKKTEREIVEAYQKQLRIAAAIASPSVACIIVSRSEYYPKIANPGDVSGKLGEFDRAEFLKNSSLPERKKLADWLDLTNEQMFPDHGYVGGVVIDPSGLVLTPYHVIDKATKIYVVLAKKGGDIVGSYADICAADSRSDLAVLKLIHPPANLKAITIAEVRLFNQDKEKATIGQGEMIGLMAYPYTSGFAFDGPSIAFGGISKVCHRLPPPTELRPQDDLKVSESYYKYGVVLEHTVKLNAAVTGGVLINLDGEMVGLTTSAAVVYNKELGPGYAIPIDKNVRRVIDVLRKGEEVEYGFLGMGPMESTNIIRTLTRHGPAEIAGLKINDTITQVNDTPINNFQDLLLHVGSALAGSEVKLTISRKGQEKVFTLTLGKFRQPQQFIASVRPAPVFGLRVDYLDIQAQQDKVPPDGLVVGVNVREVTANSPAAHKFKTLGDNPTNWIITHVNGTPIATPSEFYTITKGQPTVKLTLRDWNEAKPRELILP